MAGADVAKRAPRALEVGSAYARGLDMPARAYDYFDIEPKGRDQA